MDAITQEAATQVAQDAPAQETPVFSQEIQQEQSTAIPEKFRGKGLDDIVQSYTHLESEYGKTKQQNQELSAKAARAEELERALWATQQQQKQEQPQENALNVEQEFNRLWERDPQSAVLARAAMIERQTQNMLQDFETKSYYQKCREQVPDFAALEPKMMELMPQYAPMIRPDKVMSPETITALYKLAKAETADARINQARQQGMQETQSFNREKASAFAESPSSTGSASVSFESLPLEDMAKLLGRVEQA